MSTDFPKILGTATLNEKGQLVIPVEARQEFGLQAGSRLVIMRGVTKPVLILAKAEDIETMVQDLANALNTNN